MVKILKWWPQSRSANPPALTSSISLQHFYLFSCFWLLWTRCQFFLLLWGLYPSRVAGYTLLIIDIQNIFSILFLTVCSFALGAQTLIWRLLGAIPGPTIFGQFIDSACLQWKKSEDGCSTNTDKGSCLIYDNHSFSMYTFITHLWNYENYSTTLSCFVKFLL